MPATIVRRGLKTTSLYVNLTVDLSYEKIEPALRNCNDIDKLKRLRAEANDLEKTLPDWDFKGLLRQPYPVVRDDLGLVKLAAFGCELLLIGGKRRKEGHRVRRAETEIEKELAALRSLEERLTEARPLVQSI